MADPDMSKTSTVAIGVASFVILALLHQGCAGPLSGRTPGVPRLPNEPKTTGIAMLTAVTLGGVRQDVLIRGADRTRPIVLFLHGGPGMPSMYLAHAFQADLEREFVVVHWDRRGAGKSYASRFPVESLTVRRTLDDLYELREWLRHTVGENRVLLVGHSWGSYLGLLAVRERPDAFAAYIATGVMSPDTLESKAAQRQCVIDHARAAGDTALARQLTAPVSDSTPHVTESTLFRVGGELFASRSLWTILRTGFTAPEYTLLDGLHVRPGAQFVLAHMQRNVRDDWMIADPVLRIPVLFALGRHDCNTPSNAAAAFLDRLQAPYKSVTWFESSAHFPFWEEPARFGQVLRQADSVSLALAASGPHQR
jgi:proline iminopeptidase